MLSLQSYQGLIIDLKSIDHLYSSYPQDRITIRVNSSEVYTLVFYLAIVNKVLRHCHFWVTRQ